MSGVPTLSPEWLTPAEAANRLQLSGQQVRRLADAGRLEAQRTPLGRLVRAADVERLRREREASACLLGQAGALGTERAG
jgi:excisionase family DNA binding protein